VKVLVNENVHLSASEPPERKSFVGWGWFCLPVIINAVFLSMPTFDYNVTSNLRLYFSIPYFVLAAVIGIRRGGRLSLADLLFLTFGNFVIVTLLWFLNPPARFGS
jgi:hypothetical protein